MPTLSLQTNQRVEVTDLDTLLEGIKYQGYQLVGPTLRNKVIGYHDINSVHDLPQGLTDNQEKGHYSVHKREDNAYFGYNVGPHSWKQYLFPSREKLWSAEKKDKKFDVIPACVEEKKLAFIGVRSCDLHAIAIQDKIFIQDCYKNTNYQLRRDNILLVAINCTQAGNTCFCTSMKTGPQVTLSHDLALTEILDADEHYFIIKAGTQTGYHILSQIPHRLATQTELDLAQNKIDQASQQMGRHMDTTQIKEMLYRNHDSPQWDKVADRCLSCTNCTLVCPTCFCSKIEDSVDLTGNKTERSMSWDSCFNPNFSFIHGGNVRDSTKSRYRQWLTHKLGSWIDQFGTSGCVGCGRCIAWCPVGIDITEEIKALQEGEQCEQ